MGLHATESTPRDGSLLHRGIDIIVGPRPAGYTNPRDGGIIPRNRRLEGHPPWVGLERPRIFSTSFLIIAFYSSLILVDILAVIWTILAA